VRRPQARRANALLPVLNLGGVALVEGCPARERLIAKVSRSFPFRSAQCAEALPLLT